MKERYGDKVEFLGVYVREAHPIDGWRMSSNDKAGISVNQPRDIDDKAALAGKCSTALQTTIPLLVDTLDDRVGHAYSGMPDRLYLLDTDGRVVYKSGRGPFGFKPAELEQSIILNLLDQRKPVEK
jgi:hypothetical protein